MASSLPQRAVGEHTQAPGRGFSSQGFKYEKPMKHAETEQKYGMSKNSNLHSASDLKKWLISDPSDSSFKRLVWNYSPLKFPRKSIKKHSFPCAPWWPRRPNEPCRFDSSPSWWQFTAGGEKNNVNQWYKTLQVQVDG